MTGTVFLARNGQTADRRAAHLSWTADEHHALGKVCADRSGEVASSWRRIWHERFRVHPNILMSIVWLTGDYSRSGATELEEA